ncbi:MAG: hypothetical protein HY671_06675 [Chloroflexi bacterium]|nr:hypothetical protein [Chloroflexota bacterium]
MNYELTFMGTIIEGDMDKIPPLRIHSMKRNCPLYAKGAGGFTSEKPDENAVARFNGRGLPNELGDYGPRLGYFHTSRRPA